MVRPIPSPTATDPRAALADALASAMARTAADLAERGDPESAESLRAMARHNRILALRLRVACSLGQDLTPAPAQRDSRAA